MTQCLTCGRQSRRSDICEWCLRPIAPAGQPAPGGLPPLPMPPEMQPTTQLPRNTQPTMQMHHGAQPTMQMAPLAVNRRVSLTGEVVEEPAPPPPMATQAMHSYSPVQPMGSTSYSSSEMPASAYDAAAMAQTFGNSVPAGERWEKAMALCMPVVALSMLFLHFAPGAILGVAFADMFLLMLALGVTRAIPFFEEAMMDCGIMFVVTVFFGPLAALVVYLIVCAVKQECNGAVVTLLVISIVVPKLLEIPLISSADSMHPFLLLGLFSWLGFLGVFVGFLGWLCASFFRPLNE